MNKNRFSRVNPYLAIVMALILVAVALPQHPARAATRYYVRGNGGNDSNSGTSWGQAFRNLHKALSVAVSGDEIWVAKAVYYPDNGGPYPLDSRNATFTLKNGVKLYGGFAGTETLLSQRNITANPTILSGDVDNNDLNGDGNFIAESYTDIVGGNAYHVVITSGLNSATELDGFIITAGQATAASDPDRSGGGLYNGQGNPTLKNLTFSGNYAVLGAGMFNLDGAPSLQNVEFKNGFAIDYGGGLWNNGELTLDGGLFRDNQATVGGGGLANLGTAGDYSNPVINNFQLESNSAPVGGGMLNSYGNPSLGDVTFTNNYASNQGGGMANLDASTPSLSSVVFQGNQSVSGGGMYNMSSQPGLTFVDFLGNQASFGAGMYNDNSSPSLFGGTFDANIATNAGGGMNNLSGSAPYLELVTFKDNQADNGGGMYNYFSNPNLKKVDFLSNQASSSTAGGGGMFNYTSSPILNRVNFSGNMATNNAGGGMYNYSGSNPQLTNVNFSNNTAYNGGGMRNHLGNNQPVLTKVTFNGNEAKYGGGMSNDNSTPKIYIATFSGNVADQGGGMHNYQSSPELWNVTFFGNVANDTNQGGGMYSVTSSLPYLRNVILAGSFNGDCVLGPGGNISGWYSLIQDTGELACNATDGSSGFIIGKNPLLSPLGMNGGFTLTHAPGAGSPVIDAVMDDYCQSSTDQRGYPRWIDGNNDGFSICDIGAVEFGKQIYLPLLQK